MGFGLGVGEMLILVALFGGLTDTTAVKLHAPRDKSELAIRYVMSDADIVLHSNIEAGLGSVFGLLTEFQELSGIKESRMVSQELARGRMMLEQVIDQGSAEAGINLREGLGSVTASLALKDEDSYRMLVRVRGNFKESKVMEIMTKEVIGTYEHSDRTVYQLRDSGTFGDSVICLADDTTLLLGSQPVVEEILAKKKVTQGKQSKASAIKKLVKPGTASFVFISLPDWVIAKMKTDEDLVKMATFIAGLDYLFMSSAPRKGIVLAQATRPETAIRFNYLFKSIASLIGTYNDLFDAITYGILGIVPLIPEKEFDAEIYSILSDEKAMLELSDWARKRFTGKVRVRYDKARKSIKLELDNPASAMGMMLPFAAGIAGWSFAKQKAVDKMTPPHYDEYPGEGVLEPYVEEPPGPPPLIRHLPQVPQNQ
jgi:hypothetical protein